VPDFSALEASNCELAVDGSAGAANASVGVLANDKVPEGRPNEKPEEAELQEEEEAREPKDMLEPAEKLAKADPVLHPVTLSAGEEADRPKEPVNAPMARDPSPRCPETGGHELSLLEVTGASTLATMPKDRPPAERVAVADVETDSPSLSNSHAAHLDKSFLFGTKQDRQVQVSFLIRAANAF